MFFIAVALGVVSIALIMLYNGIISTKNSVIESYSAIDTVLQNRYDLIPNLVEVVKGYAAHESKTLAEITEIRSRLLENHSPDKSRFDQENALSTRAKSIFALAESYPDLKASENFLKLQEQWTEIEDRLQGARRAYNASVKELLNMKEMFPSNVVAGMMTLPEYPMFEAENAAKETPGITMP